jgi:hypothetical protein
MEILQQIPALPEREVLLIEAALRSRRVEVARQNAAQGGVRPAFENIAERIFSTHGELLHRLSQ